MNKIMEGVGVTPEPILIPLIDYWGPNETLREAVVSIAGRYLDQAATLTADSWVPPVDLSDLVTGLLIDDLKDFIMRSVILCINDTLRKCAALTPKIKIKLIPELILHCLDVIANPFDNRLMVCGWNPYRNCFKHAGNVMYYINTYCEDCIAAHDFFLKRWSDDEMLELVDDPTRKTFFWILANNFTTLLSEYLKCTLTQENSNVVRDAAAAYLGETGKQRLDEERRFTKGCITAAPITWNDLWYSGFVLADGKRYNFEAKVYDVGSKYGINNGRVSKLHVSDTEGNEIINYDRGWDIKPKTDLAKEILNGILGAFPNKKKEDADLVNETITNTISEICSSINKVYPCGKEEKPALKDTKQKDSEAKK
jgi:hypothetical protein